MKYNKRILFISFWLALLVIILFLFLIKKDNQENSHISPDMSNISIPVKQEDPEEIQKKQDIELGVVEITPRKGFSDYILPAMVKLLPRETILGVKKGHGSNLRDRITFIFPYAPRGSDTTRVVRLDPYWIGQYEVTLYEFEKYLKDTGKNKKDVLIDGDKQVKPNRPVVGIYRKDAIEYCEWLSKKTGMKFRLPTEDEWEYAARSGYEQKPTPYGDEMPFKYYDYSKYKKHIDDIIDKEIGYEPYNNFNWDILYKIIHDVGSFPPTRYYLYDMGGNVHEWTYHDYAPDVYRIKDVGNVYDRIYDNHDFALIDLGFRLVREIKN